MSLLTGLEAYWSLDTSAGAGPVTSPDATGNGHTLTLSGVTLTTGKIGNGLAPVAGAQVATFGAIPLATPGGFTLALWMKIASQTGFGCLIAEGGPGQGLYINSAGHLDFVVAGVEKISALSYFLAAWQAIMVTYDGTTLKFYVGNVLTDSFAVTFTANLWSPTNIGDYSNVDPFNGNLDEVALASREWSAPERAQWFNGGAGLAYPLTPPAPPPAISAIYPVSGFDVGGTAVSITGTDFDPAAVAKVGGMPLASAVVVGPTLITGRTPPHTPGLVAVLVTNPDTQFSTVDAFTYRDSYRTPGTRPDFTPPADTAVPRARALAFDFKTGAFVRSNGRATYVVDLEAIRQAIEIRLQSFRNEWFLDIGNGLPYFTEILIKAPNLNAIEQTIRREIENVPGVKSVKTITLSLNKATRVLQVTWFADSDLGELTGSTNLNT